MRSAKAPTIRAGVMIAKVNWKTENTDSGIDPLSASTPTPDMNALPRPPTKPPMSSPKARLYRYSDQRIVMRQVIAKHCIITDSAFLARTMPA